jgi:2-oxoglutarate ferredoxin oxidoreductase subunit delta
MTRGTVLIQTERCKGCALCVHACPQHVLHLSTVHNARGYTPVQLDESAGGEAGAHCTGCAICALVCPDLVFTVFREPLSQRRAA